MIPRWRPPHTAAGLLPLALVLALASPARAAGPAPLLRCVQQRYAALRDLSADFAQESRVASLGRPRSRAGRLYFLPPGRMRWEYEPPDPQLIVADGRQVWFYRPERRQAIVQPVGENEARQTPFLFLLGRGEFAREFTWEEREPAPAPGGAVRVRLTPRAETPEMARLELEIVPGECRLAATLVEDAYGNRTRLSFSAERVGTAPDPGLFRFTPPAGTEIVKP